jgi:hypothetical protein
MTYLFILLILITIIYLKSAQGITDSNSGSSYALVKALAEDKSLKINNYLKYTKHIDYAKFNGNFYTDRPPGMAFFALPFYKLGLNVTYLSAIAGTVSTGIVFLITELLTNSSSIAFIVGCVFAFCTINWRYSTLFFIHSLGTCLVLSGVYLYILEYPLILVGFLIGLATFVEYTNATFMIGLTFVSILEGHIPYYLIAWFFLGVAPLLIYNEKCFGEPFVTAYKYSGYFEWEHSLKTTFVTPIWTGLHGLLYFITKEGRYKVGGGIYTMSPILIFGGIGYIYLPRDIAILFIALCLPLLLLISKHITWWGGNQNDYRYVMAIIPYMTIPLGCLLAEHFFMGFIFVIISGSISIGMVMIRLLVLTVTDNDLKACNGVVDYIKLIFSGLFLRKIGK